MGVKGLPSLHGARCGQVENGGRTGTQTRTTHLASRPSPPCAQLTAGVALTLDGAPLQRESVADRKVRGQRQWPGPHDRDSVTCAYF